MKKKLYLLTAVTLIGSLFISGCNNSAFENDDRNVTKLDGEYIKLDNGYLMINDFDSAIESLNPDESSLSVIFDDNEFEISFHDNALKKYSGTIKNDEELKFKYQEYFVPAGQSMGIDIMTGQEILSNEMLVNIKENYDDLSMYDAKKVIYDKMKKLNETGSFINQILPSPYYSDKLIAYNDVFPFCIARDRISGANSQFPTILKHTGDFLCTDVYGMKLESKYRYGMNFTIEFDVLDPYIKDKYSSVNMSDDEELLERKKMSLKSYITDNSDNFSTTIEFSDGEWEWYNSSGNLINNGEYQESKQHKGLIAMYITEDSKNGRISNNSPLILYIDKKGEIYYPAFIKCDDNFAHSKKTKNIKAEKLHKV